MKMIAYFAIPCAIAGILFYGWLHKVEIFPAFAAGAKKGLQTACSMLPPLVLFLAILGMLEASGGLDALCYFLRPLAEKAGIPSEVVPLGLLRPLSGSGSLAVFREILAESGPDSFAGRTASVIQSASETTFYTLAVYFGAAKINRSRYALLCSLAGDFVIILSAGWLVRWLL
ncbi:MAG: spore maturation protein [Candidatus Merdivicinus sp.]